MNRKELRRRITATTYHALYWARHHVAPGVRSLLGVLLMAGGVLGFLPVLGFWMFPLGLAFVAMDLPGTDRGIDRWMRRLARQAALASVAVPSRAASGIEPAATKGTRNGTGPDHFTSSQ